MSGQSARVIGYSPTAAAGVIGDLDTRWSDGFVAAAHEGAFRPDVLSSPASRWRAVAVS